MSMNFSYTDEENARISTCHNGNGQYYFWCREGTDSAMVYLPTEVEKINELITFLENYKQTLEKKMRFTLNDYKAFYKDAKTQEQKKAAFDNAYFNLSELDFNEFHKWQINLMENNNA